MSTKMLGFLFIVLLLGTQVNTLWPGCLPYTKEKCEDQCKVHEEPGFVDTDKTMKSRADCEACHGVFCAGFWYDATETYYEDYYRY